MCQCVKVEYRSLYSSECVNCAYSEVAATLRISEQAFENAIADVLLASGYHRHFSQEFDRENAIFPNEVLAFIQFTQPKVWEKLEIAHGDKTGDRVIAALCKTSYRQQTKSKSKGNS